MTGEAGWTVLLLAGQRPGTDPLAAAFGQQWKALVPVAAPVTPSPFAEFVTLPMGVKVIYGSSPPFRSKWASSHDTMSASTTSRSRSFNGS